ncbi:MAG: protein-S-isoprenylcysteine O-methyltransferase [Anaerolineaceae bacterium]
MNIFEVCYWTAILLEIAIRIPLQKARKKFPRIEQHISRTDTFLLGGLFVTMVLIPLIYTATRWLDFANYHLAGWVGWLGVLLLIGSIVIFARAHLDLKSNWSPSLEIYGKHALITDGIYKYIRHPMYASQWLWVIAQILLLQNWLAGPIDLFFFIPFYILRVRAEEKMMINQFGDGYLNYKKKTGGVIPKLTRNH